MATQPQPPTKEELLAQMEDVSDDALSEVNATKDVLAYGDLQKQISEATGYPVAHVRDVLQHAQRIIAQHCRAQVGNRVHFGRLLTIYSQQTRDRLVNNPRNIGQQLLSKGHIKLSVSIGSHTKQFMKGERTSWGSGGE